MRIFAIALIFSLGIAAPVLGNDFTELKSAHFIIRYQKGVDKAYVYKTKDIAEKFYNIITREFNLIRDNLWLWDNRAKIIIAKDKQQYVSAFPCSEWSGACVDYFSKIIYTYPNQSRFNSILIHELTHIIFREYVRGGGSYPVWLDEGMATYMEDKHSKGVYQRGFLTLRKRIKDGTYIKFSDLNRVSVSSLSGRSKEEVSYFYLQSFSIVYFIVNRYGKDGFYKFLYYLKQGYAIETALSRVVYELKDIEALEKAWKKFYLK